VPSEPYFLPSLVRNLEDTPLDPLTLASHDPDDLFGSHGAEEMDCQPGPHVFVFAAQDVLADFANGPGLVGDLPEWEFLDAVQVDRRNVLQVHSPLEHCFDCLEVVIDSASCSEFLLTEHVILQVLEVDCADCFRPVSGMAGQESPKVLGVEVLAVPAALGEPALQELVTEFLDRELPERTGQDSLALRLPFRPVSEGVQILLVARVLVLREDMVLPAPTAEVDAGVMLPECRSWAGHNGAKSTSSGGTPSISGGAMYL